MSNLISISDARANLPDLVSKVNKNMDRVIITVNGQPKAVVLSPEELESLEETLEILSIPGARKSIKQGVKEAREGKVIPLKDLIADLK